MRPPVWLLATLQRLLPAKSPTQIGPRENGVTHYQTTAPLSLEDDRRPIAPIRDELGDATRALTREQLQQALEHAADKFPPRPAQPRHRKATTSTWARMYGQLRRIGGDSNVDEPKNRGPWR